MPRRPRPLPRKCAKEGRAVDPTADPAGSSKKGVRPPAKGVWRSAKGVSKSREGGPSIARQGSGARQRGSGVAVERESASSDPDLRSPEPNSRSPDPLRPISGPSTPNLPSGSVARPPPFSIDRTSATLRAKRSALATQPENPALEEALEHALAPYQKLLSAAELAELREILARALVEDPTVSRLLSALRERAPKDKSDDAPVLDGPATTTSDAAAAKGRKERG